MKNNKRAFTIVELVIVIAVIGILAAVLIPTFSSLIEKANMNSDEAAVKNMNTYLSADEQINGKPAVWQDAVKVLSKSGLDAQNYKALSSEHYLVWDSSINRVLYVEKASGQVIYPEEYKNLTEGDDYTYGNWMTLEGQMVADDSWLNQEQDYSSFDKVEISNGEVKYEDKVITESNAKEEVAGYQSYFGNNVAANLLALEFKNSDTKYGQLKYESNGVEYVIAKVKDSQQLTSYAEYVKKSDNDGENFTLLLTGDIEFNNTQWKPIETYKGSVDGSYKTEDGTVKPAVLKNFNMSDRSAEVVMYESGTKGGSNFYYGFISVFTGGYLGNFEFENVNVVTPGLDVAAPMGYEKTGVYVATVCGLITNEKQEGTVVVENIHVKSGTVTGYSRVGGLFGCVGMTKALSSNGYLNSGTIEIRNCSNAATVVSKAETSGSYANAAGIAAFTHRIQNDAVVKYIDCVNTGNIAGVNAAGINGRYVNNTQFINCKNSGKITAIATDKAYSDANGIYTAKVAVAPKACGIACSESKIGGFTGCENTGTIAIVSAFDKASVSVTSNAIAASISDSDLVSECTASGAFEFDIAYFAGLTVKPQGAEFNPSVKGAFFADNNATEAEGVYTYIAK